MKDLFFTNLLFYLASPLIRNLVPHMVVHNINQLQSINLTQELLYCTYSSLSIEMLWLNVLPDNPLRILSSSINFDLCLNFKWFHIFVVLEPEFTYRLLHKLQITLRPTSSFLKTCHTSLILVAFSKTKNKILTIIIYNMIINYKYKLYISFVNIPILMK
jgi:hypothetical protein